DWFEMVWSRAKFRVRNGESEGFSPHPRPPRRWPIKQLAFCRKYSYSKGRVTNRVRRLLILVPLLVGSSLGLIGTTLLLRESLPALTKNLANLTCKRVRF